MKKLLIPILIVLLTISTSVFAQEFQSIEGLKRRFFEKVLPITGDNDAVEGYVVYYMKEKVKKEKGKPRTRIFAVKSYDKDLNPIKENTIEITISTNILSTAFNGKNLCVVLGDARKKTLTALSYDKSGDQIGKTLWVVDKWFETDLDVYPSSNGFFIQKVLRQKKMGFEILSLDNKMNKKWEKKFIPEKGYTNTLITKSIDDKLVLLKMTGASVLSKKMKIELVTVDEKEGDILGQFNLFDGTNSLIPSTFRFDKENNVVLGGMYFEGEKFRNVNSKGVFVMKTDLSGKNKDSKTLPWKGKMQKYLSAVKTKGLRIDGKNKVLFEDIILHKNGFQLIGEAFSKTAIQIGPSISDFTIGRSSNSNSKPGIFNVKDILVFNFSNNLDFNDMQIIPKKEVNISTYPPYNSYSGLRLALSVQSLGLFNYRFSIKENPDDENFTIISTNLGAFLENFKKGVRYSVAKIEKGKVVCEESLKEIKLYGEKSKIRTYGLLRNNDNKMLVYYYDPKFDAVRMYIETISK